MSNIIPFPEPPHYEKFTGAIDAKIFPDEFEGVEYLDITIEVYDNNKNLIFGCSETYDEFKMVTYEDDPEIETGYCHLYCYDDCAKKHQKLGLLVPLIGKIKVNPDNKYYEIAIQPDHLIDLWVYIVMITYDDMDDIIDEEIEREL